jgi:hypothetical protein
VEKSIRGIQQLNDRILFIKLYISSENDFSFDRIKQSIGFQLFRVSHHDESMNIFIQLLSAIIRNVSLGNTSKHIEVVD